MNIRKSATLDRPHNSLKQNVCLSFQWKENARQLLFIFLVVAFHYLTYFALWILIA